MVKASTYCMSQDWGEASSSLHQLLFEKLDSCRWMVLHSSVFNSFFSFLTHSHSQSSSFSTLSTSENVGNLSCYISKLSVGFLLQFWSEKLPCKFSLGDGSSSSELFLDELSLESEINLRQIFLHFPWNGILLHFSCHLRPPDMTPSESLHFLVVSYHPRERHVTLVGAAPLHVFQGPSKSLSTLLKWYCKLNGILIDYNCYEKFDRKFNLETKFINLMLRA